jgi:hypothetical protein
MGSAKKGKQTLLKRLLIRLRAEFQINKDKEV